MCSSLLFLYDNYCKFQRDITLLLHVSSIDVYMYMALLTLSNVLSSRERKEDRDRHKGKSEVSALAGLMKCRIKRFLKMQLKPTILNLRGNEK